MNRSRSTALAGGLGLLLLLLPPTVSAQAPLPVDVCFRFGEASVGNLFNPDTARVEDEISARIASDCQALIRNWTFTAGTDSDVPRLQVWLREDSGWHLDMAVVTRATPPATTLGADFSEPVFEPGEIQRVYLGFPERDDWPVLAERAARGLVFRESVRVIDRLKDQAPLGKGMVPMTRLDPAADPRRALLPLGRQELCHLLTSRFRILCVSGAGKVVVLRSKGIAEFSQFPASPAFAGIVIEHETWESPLGATRVDVSTVLDALADLRSRFIFLEADDAANGDVICDILKGE